MSSTDLADLKRIYQKTGRTAYHHRYNCRNCRRNRRKREGKDPGPQRFTVKRFSAHRDVRCPACNSTDVVSIEAHRRREMGKRKRDQKLCQCGGVPFPHDKGTVYGCTEFDTSKLTDEQAIEAEQNWRDMIMNSDRGTY